MISETALYVKCVYEKKEKKKGILIRSFSRLAAEQFYHSTWLIWPMMYVLVPGPGAYYYRIINVYKVVCSSILIVCKIIFS